MNRRSALQVVRHALPHVMAASSIVTVVLALLWPHTLAWVLGPAFLLLSLGASPLADAAVERGRRIESEASAADADRAQYLPAALAEVDSWLPWTEPVAPKAVGPSLGAQLAGGWMSTGAGLANQGQPPSWYEAASPEQRLIEAPPEVLDWLEQHPIEPAPVPTCKPWCGLEWNHPGVPRDGTPLLYCDSRCSPRGACSMACYHAKYPVNLPDWPLKERP